MTRASASWTASFAVAAASRVVDASAAKVTDEGGAPSSTLPACPTETVTVSAAAVLPVRVSVNTAAVPSVTGEDAAATDTTGSVGAAVAFVTSTSAKETTRLPAASRSGAASSPVGTV